MLLDQFGQGPSTRPILAGQERFSIDQHTFTPLRSESPGLGRLAQGSTHKTIYMPDIELIRIPLPSPEEQRVIVEETWHRLRRADNTIERLRQQIGVLEERRQALITAAVTGELQIPGAAA